MQKISKTNIIEIILIDSILSIFTQTYTSVFKDNIFSNVGITKDTVKELILNCITFRVIIPLILYGIVLWIIFMYKKQIASFVYKYRYLFAFGLLIFCVVSEINGSSIGMWINYLPHSSKDSEGVLFGVSRIIRTDEWAVSTPMAFSQYYSHFSYFSHVVRGSSTDLFIIYGQAVRDIAIIFRPFYIGYLVLSPAKGLAFFWCGRLIALFMVTFELGMLITNRNKRYSVVIAFLITFAPAVQWWFAVNGFVEMLIFSQLAVIILYKYMRTENYIKRVLFATVLVFCAAVYGLTFYPAWQVPLFYVLMALIAWVFITNYKEFKFSLKKDIPIFFTVTILFGIVMYHILSNSMDTIKTVLSTVYPGSRVDLGGNGFRYLWKSISNIFLPIKGYGVPLNQCEDSVIFDLFPLGLIISLYVIFKEKKKDLLLIFLLSIDAILTMYVIFPLPRTIAKILLLSHSTTIRTNIVIGLINILLLIRSLSITQVIFNKYKTVIFTFVLSTIVTYFAAKSMGNYMSNTMKLISFVTLFLLFYIVLLNNKLKEIFTIIICMLMLFMGGLVNPVRTGEGIIYKSELSNKIESITKTDKGLWIVEDMGLPMINYPMMLGAPTINCTNTYPDIERWRKLDNQGKYDSVYNRYAHIKIKLGNEMTDFTLNTPDSFNVTLNTNDLIKLKVKYILSPNELVSFSNNNVEINKLTQVGDYKIYKVVY